MPIQKSLRSIARTVLVLLPALVAACASTARTSPATVAGHARLRPAIKYDMIALEGSIAEHFELARACGFEGVEVDSPSTLDREAVIAAARATGVEVHGVIDSVHWQTRLSDPDPAVRAQAVAALRTAIDDAHAFGASTVLVVPGAVRDPEHENYAQVWQRSQAGIALVLPHAHDMGVRIAIEVVWNGFITTPAELVRYVDEFHDATVGAYFDCSNMVKFGTPDAAWIRALGPRLLKIDFKGYSLARGWVGIGEGDEDWPSVLAALGAIGYEGWATAEVEAGGREHLLDVKRRMDRVLGS